MNRAVRVFLAGVIAALAIGCLPKNNCAVTATCMPEPGEVDAGRDSGGDTSSFDASDAGDARADVSASYDAMVEDRGTGNAAPDGAVVSDDAGAAAPGAALLSIDPAIKDFSSVVTGLFAEAAFQVSNTGGQPSTVPVVDLDGTDEALFSISTNGCIAALPVGGTCVVNVRFSPTAAGPKSARLNVNATLGGAVSASLQGVGVPPQALAIAPSNTTFGSVLQGTQTAPTTMTVTNTGGIATGMLVTSIAGSTEFVLSADACSGRPLAAAASCALTVVFAPSSAGQKSGTLVVSGTPGGIASSGLNGVGLGPASLSLTPAAATFAGTIVGATSAAQSFTVTNRGGIAAGTATALAAALAGPNAADFTVSSNTCTATLAPAATCTITVAFKPAAANDRAATLTVSAAPGTSATASLAGKGLSPASLSLAPASGSSADFGMVIVGTTGTETFVLSNPGQQPSTRLTVGVTGTGFAVSTPAAGDRVSGTTLLAPGETCTVHVSLAPTAAGTPSGTLTVSATTGGSTMLALRGTAVGPGALTIAPATQTFPSLLPGVLGTPLTFTVTNTGGAATGTLAATISRSTEFAIVTDGCGGKILAPAATCTLSIRFAPASAGQKTGTLSISATPGGVATSALAGTAQGAASLSVSPTTFSFASTVVGATSAPQSFTVTNNGDVAAGGTTAIAAALSGTNATEFTIASNTCTSTLAARATCTVAISFRPSSAGSGKRGTLTVSGTPGGAPTVSLSGAALSPAALGLAAASGSAVDFGSVVVGATSQPQTYVVSNTGQQSTSALTIALPSGAGFAVVAPTGTDCVSNPASNATTLAPGATCTVRVRFTPPSPGIQSARLAASAASGGSRTLDLGGTGACPMGRTACGGVCADTSSDKQNCGGCGAPCEAYQYCGSGRCVPHYESTRILETRPTSITDPGSQFLVAAALETNGDLLVEVGLGNSSVTLSSITDPIFTQVRADTPYNTGPYTMGTVGIARYLPSGPLVWALDATAFLGGSNILPGTIGPVAVASNGDVMLAYEKLDPPPPPDAPIPRSTHYHLTRINGSSPTIIWDAVYDGSSSACTVVPRRTRGDFVTVGMPGQVERPPAGEIDTSVAQIADGATQATTLSLYLGGGWPALGGGALLGGDGSTLWIWRSFNQGLSGRLNPWSAMTWSISPNPGPNDAYIIGAKDNGESLGPWITAGSSGTFLDLVVDPAGDLIALVGATGLTTLNGTQTLATGRGQSLVKLSGTTGNVIWRTDIADRWESSLYVKIAMVPGNAVVSVTPAVDEFGNPIPSQPYVVRFFSASDGHMLTSFSTGSLSFGPATTSFRMVSSTNDLFIVGLTNSAGDFNPGAGTDMKGNPPGVFVSRFSF